MGKRNTTKVQLPESKLLKALSELSEDVEKGDALEDRDPEGGLSTEGSPLSNAAPKGKSTKKSARHESTADESDEDDESEVEKSDSESIVSKMLSCSGDDDESPPPFKKKKSKKVAKAESMSSGSDDDSEGADDESDEPAKKSFRETAEQDETVSKGMEVSTFLEALVDQLSISLMQIDARVAKSMKRLEERLGSRIDNRVAKSVAIQQDFNARLAKGMKAIGETVQNDVIDMIKSLGDAPAAPRGKALLSKGEVNQPPWSGNQAGEGRMANGSDDDFVAELGDLSQEAIGNWLFQKSCANTIDPKLIFAWENAHYNVEALPVQVRKSLANDLLK